MLTAAKGGTFSASRDPCVLFSLAASEGVPKNSRLGFARRLLAPHQGSAWSNSGKALGIHEVVWENGGGSDDSARYYDPNAGRFISEDPIGFHGGASSFYGYVGNNTPNFVDPGGKCASEIHRCAASLAEEYSLSSLLHIPLIATNTVADVSKLIVGPEPGTDPATAQLDRGDQYAGIGAEFVEQVFEHVVEKIGTGWDLVHEAPTGLLKFTPETIGDLALVGNISVKSALGVLGIAKLVYDAEIYVLAEGVCIYTGAAE